MSNYLSKFVQINIEKLKNIAETLASIAVILGIILFFYEDYLTTKREKFSATYDLYILFQSDDYTDVRYGLILPWTKYDLDTLKAANPPQIVINIFIRDIVKKNQDTFKSLYALDQFVQGLETCINANVCDKKAAHDLFGQFINDAYCLYNPAFPEIAQRLQMQEFGLPIERLAKEKGNCRNSS